MITAFMLPGLVNSSCMSQSHAAFFRSKNVAHAEAIIAGFDLSSPSTENALQLLGRPDRVTENKGTKIFEWNAKECKLSLTAREQWLISIDVQGTPECKYGSTGRGLRLGDPSVNLENVYPSSVVSSDLQACR